ncbi:60S ribosomal protein L39-like [Arvicola amphibius]|uniref:60S ribosomal protein L39-like n=1 Tax=Arvicola amphibius TaxID=1047088 RepID=UPI001C092F94|nr:60S ribosomal protein L39-like [Arvicola amphibius]
MIVMNKISLKRGSRILFFQSGPPPPLSCAMCTIHLTRLLAVSSHKTFRIKQFLAKRANHPVPQWIRMKTGNKIRFNSKRRHWRRTKLGL